MRHGWMLCLAVAAAALVAPAAASAASVAYIDNGNVWVSSLDGTQKKQLTTDGSWREVAQSDNGRTVAVRRRDGEAAPLSQIAVWNASGARVLDGPLPKPQLDGYTIHAYPLGLDITADGGGLVYGFSNSAYVNQYIFQRGHYFIGLGTPWFIDPYTNTGAEWPSFVGDRVVGESGGQVVVQRPGGSGVTDFDPWLNPIPGYDLGRTDVAANGRIAALEMTKYDNNINQTAGFIDMTPVNALGDTNVPPGACILPTTGLARNVSLSQDATRVAWEDDGGVWVAGAPDFLGNGPASSIAGNTTCVLTSPPVRISGTGDYPSIGGANVADMLPAPAPAPGPAPVGPDTTPTILSVKLPASTPIAALRKGLAVRVSAPRAGLVTVTATVPGKRLGLRGAAARRPALIAKGTARVAAARVIAVKLRLTALGRAKSARLKGAKATVRIKLGTKVLTRTLRLR